MHSTTTRCDFTLFPSEILFYKVCCFSIWRLFFLYGIKIQRVAYSHRSKISLISKPLQYQSLCDMVLKMEIITKLLMDRWEPFWYHTLFMAVFLELWESPFPWMRSKLTHGMVSGCFTFGTHVSVYLSFLTVQMH